MKIFSSSFLEFLRTRPFATKQGVSFPLEGGKTLLPPRGWRTLGHGEYKCGSHFREPPMETNTEHLRYKKKTIMLMSSAKVANYLGSAKLILRNLPC